jgi:hypothetical protein
MYGPGGATPKNGIGTIGGQPLLRNPSGNNPNHHSNNANGSLLMSNSHQGVPHQMNQHSVPMNMNPVFAPLFQFVQQSGTGGPISGSATSGPPSNPSISGAGLNSYGPSQSMGSMNNSVPLNNSGLSGGHMPPSQMQNLGPPPSVTPVSTFHESSISQHQVSRQSAQPHQRYLSCSVNWCTYWVC